MLKSFLKKIPLAISINRYLRRKATHFLYGADEQKRFTKINVLRTFPLYKPASGGTYEDRSRLTIQTINQTMPFLSSLAQSVSTRTINFIDMKTFPTSAADLEASNALKGCLDRYGSDKANDRHNYHNLYGPILRNRDQITSILEVGLGSDSNRIVSAMGPGHKPGASLRGFRDFLPNAKLYGADVDRTILFKEERIETFFVDQTDPRTFDGLKACIPSDLDLVIDDGLHSPDANIATLNFGLSRIRVGAWVVIEDIIADAVPLWELVAMLLPNRYRTYIFNAAGSGIAFAVQRLS